MCGETTKKKGLRTRRKWTRELSVVLCLSLVLARAPVYVAVVAIMFFFARAHRLPCNPLGGRGFITALNWLSGLSINFPFFFVIFFDSVLIGGEMEGMLIDMFAHPSTNPHRGRLVDQGQVGSLGL